MIQLSAEQEIERLEVAVHDLRLVVVQRGDAAARAARSTRAPRGQCDLDARVGLQHLPHRALGAELHHHRHLRVEAGAKEVDHVGRLDGGEDLELLLELLRLLLGLGLLEHLDRHRVHAAVLRVAIDAAHHRAARAAAELLEELERRRVDPVAGVDLDVLQLLELRLDALHARRAKVGLRRRHLERRVLGLGRVALRAVVAAGRIRDRVLLLRLALLTAARLLLAQLLDRLHDADARAGRA
jgi:hypothetical protein